MFFACLDDRGLVVIQRESAEQVEWTEFAEIPAGEIRRHVNENGLAKLAAGKQILFVGQDQSARELYRLFA